MATKNDLGKNRLELIDPIIIDEIAKVINKVVDRPCELKDRTFLYGNTIDHLNAWRGGEDINQTSNLRHLSHAAFNVCMLIELDRTNSKIVLNNEIDSYALIPSSFFEELGQVLTFGAKKYAAFNWCAGRGLDSLRLYGATLRHLVAYHNGEILDPESGLSHLSHVACELMFLLYFQVLNRGDDTRPHLVRAEGAAAVIPVVNPVVTERK